MTEEQANDALFDLLDTHLEEEHYRDPQNFKDFDVDQLMELFKYQLTFNPEFESVEVRKEDKYNPIKKDIWGHVVKKINLNESSSNKVTSNDKVMLLREYYDGSFVEVGDIVLSFNEVIPANFLEGRPDDDEVVSYVCPRLFEKFVQDFCQYDMLNSNLISLDLPTFKRK